VLRGHQQRQPSRRLSARARLRHHPWASAGVAEAFHPRDHLGMNLFPRFFRSTGPGQIGPICPRGKIWETFFANTLSFTGTKIFPQKMFPQLNRSLSTKKSFTTALHAQTSYRHNCVRKWQNSSNRWQEHQRSHSSVSTANMRLQHAHAS
jgi:hypothetical protein